MSTTAPEYRPALFRLDKMHKMDSVIFTPFPQNMG